MKILNLTKSKIDAIINIGTTLISLGNQIKSLLDVDEADFQEIDEHHIPKSKSDFKVVELDNEIRQLNE